MTTYTGKENRKRVLTDADVGAIAKELAAIQEAQHCRYNITPERLEAAVKFFENFNAIVEDSKSTIRRTVLNIVVILILALIGLGAGYKIWSIFPNKTP